VLKGIEEANKRNEGRRFYTIAHRVKAGFWFVNTEIIKLEMTN